MKIQVGLKFFLAIFLAAMVTGCVTHKVDWAARLGHYTFDQAVVEMGPPDKQAKLSDGKMVAEWVTRFSSGGTVMVGGGFYGHPGGMGFVETGPNYYERKLRLTFTTNNLLAAWSKH